MKLTHPGDDETSVPSTSKVISVEKEDAFEMHSTSKAKSEYNIGTISREVESDAVFPHRHPYCLNFVSRQMLDARLMFSDTLNTCLHNIGHRHVFASQQTNHNTRAH